MRIATCIVRQRLHGYSMSSNIKIAIVAGEPSGDLLAAMLINQLQKHSSEPIEFMGIGGDQMAKYDFKSSYDMSILSVGGFGFEVIRAIPKILWIRHKIIKQIIDFKPDVFIGVDAPDFNFYVEKKLHDSGIKTVHYISPTIWAWRYDRIYSIKKSTDLMLCIFPMEETIYHKEGIQAKFVGHQLANNTELEINTEAYKQKLSLTGVVFTILAGSRAFEIKKLAKVFIKTCELINQAIPNTTFIFPFANQKTEQIFLSELGSYNPTFEYKALVGQTSDAIKASDMVLAKSGTVTLEVALCKKPLIISYKVSKLTEWIVRRTLRIKYAGQPNILLNEEVAPELLQEKANPQDLAAEFIKLYNDKTRQAYMIGKFKQLHLSLRTADDSTAAKAIVRLINVKKL
jgi:lipid-A-disaccharide synthase